MQNHQPSVSYNDEQTKKIKERNSEERKRWFYKSLEMFGYIFTERFMLFKGKITEVETLDNEKYTCLLTTDIAVSFPQFWLPAQLLKGVFFE